MSDVSQGVGWWQASDGRWYPPKESDEAPAPGYWLAADGRWYPPVESADPPAPGWWLAADGRWYPPESADGAVDAVDAVDGDSSDDADGPVDDVSVADGDSDVEASIEPIGSDESDDESDGGSGDDSEDESNGGWGVDARHGLMAVPPLEAEHESEDDPDADQADASARGPRRPMSAADRPPRTVEAASTRAAASRPRPSDASQQIRRRDDASREDAIAQASARFMAASRALKFLEADIEDNREHPGMSAARTTARAAQAEATGAPRSGVDAMAEPDADAAPSTSTPPSVWAAAGPSADPGQLDGSTSAPVAASAGATTSADGSTPSDADEAESEPVSTGSVSGAGSSDPVRTARAGDAAEAVAAGADAGSSEPIELAVAASGSSSELADAPSPPPAAPPQPPRSSRGTGRRPVDPADDLLIELRTSPLGADIDHIGDRLLVFVDRVELRDRNDRVRQVLTGEDITDVVVQRKFTGAVLAVESGSGESIVTRGLKPEQADQARLLIHKRTRAGRPVLPKANQKAAPAPRHDPRVNGPMPPSAAAPSPDAVAAAAARLAILNRDRLNEADLLRKLADLHRAGVLTDSEFEEKITLVGRLVSGETLVVS